MPEVDRFALSVSSASRRKVELKLLHRHDRTEVNPCLDLALRQGSTPTKCPRPGARGLRRHRATYNLFAGDLRLVME